MSEIKSTFCSVILAFITIILFLTVAAALYIKFDFSQSYLSLIMQSIYMVSSFISGFAAARLTGKNGILSGLIPSLIISVICLALTFLFGGIKISKMIVVTIILITGFGSLGGVISLNVGKNKGV